MLLNNLHTNKVSTKTHQSTRHRTPVISTNLLNSSIQFKHPLPTYKSGFFASKTNLTTLSNSTKVGTNCCLTSLGRHQGRRNCPFVMDPETLTIGVSWNATVPPGYTKTVVTPSCSRALTRMSASLRGSPARGWGFGLELAA